MAKTVKELEAASAASGGRCGSLCNSRPERQGLGRSPSKHSFAPSASHEEHPHPRPAGIRKGKFVPDKMPGQGRTGYGKMAGHPQMGRLVRMAGVFFDCHPHFGPYLRMGCPIRPGRTQRMAGIDYGHWHLNYSFIYTGERYEAVANIPENHAQPWYTSDLSLSRNFALGRHELKGTLEVNNIFNQQYEIVQCYPMPGTNFRLILSWKL